MIARPILFSGPMIRALLDGRKTQTRRVVKDHTFYACLTGDCPHDTQRECDQAMATECRYGQPGDLLWVRETWADLRGGGFGQQFAYAASTDSRGNEIRREYGVKWKPSIHMPRAASRLTLRITDVRVQRLQDISEEDARAEGVEPLHGGMPEHADKDRPTHYAAYARLWDTINGAGSWAANPWCWAISFEGIKANVDSVLTRSAA